MKAALALVIVLVALAAPSLQWNRPGQADPSPADPRRPRCKTFCPALWQPVCTEDSEGNNYMFGNECQKEVCECKLGYDLSVVDNEHKCRGLRTNICPVDDTRRIKHSQPVGGSDSSSDASSQDSSSDSSSDN